MDKDDTISIDLSTLEKGDVKMKNINKNLETLLTHTLSPREITILKQGGKLPFIKGKQRG
jgi:hypothetical protein